MTCQTAGGEILGIPARVPNDNRTYLHNQRMGKVVINRPDLVDENFLYWLFLWQEFGRELFVSATGTKILHTAPRRIEAFRFRCPPLPEQRAIAAVLGSLDDKIELNRRMNETLEALAQSLFKSWFVDACLRQGYGGQATESALPKGWREESLDKVATFLNGLALQNFPANGDDSLPVIKIAQLRAGNTDGADRASSEVPAAYVIEDGDVLFSWSGSLEVELWCGGRGALNQHLFKVSSEQFPKWFYFLWTRHHLPEFQAIAADKATTMGHIQRKHLTEAKVFVPQQSELKKMSETMSPLVDKLIANNLESRTLAALRDALLPKLLSGELRVPAAAKPMGARA
jgi:type I restriction enzyme S subunit